MSGQCEHAGGVILAKEEPTQSSRQDLGAFELGSPGISAAVFHRRAGIAKQVEPQIGFLHISADTQAIAAGEQSPIKAPQIVAGLIATVIAEFDAESMKRAAMQSVEKAFHDVPGLKRQPFQTRKELGIETFSKALGLRDHLSRDVLKQATDDIVGGLAFGIGLEGANEPMAQHERSQCRNIVAGDIEPTFTSCSSAPGQN